MKNSNKPKFKNEDEEREFWASHSPLDYFNTNSARKVISPNLKTSTRAISIRLPESMLDELKILANKRDVPYQSLVKIYLSWGIQAERRAMETK